MEQLVDLDEEYDHSVEYGRMGGGTAVDYTRNLRVIEIIFNARGMAPTNIGSIYLKNKKDNSFEIRGPVIR